MATGAGATLRVTALLEASGPKETEVAFQAPPLNPKGYGRSECTTCARSVRPKVTKSPSGQP